MCSLVLQALGLNYETDLIVLSADYKPKETISDVTALKTELEERADACKDEQASFRKEFERDME